jgi:3',5'-cyclic AMP phosphodiesterase CpdA
MPVHLLLGNHDDRDNFLAAFPEAPRDRDGFVQQGFDTPAGRMILLDTKLPGTHAGGLCERRLAWLAEEMADGEAPVFLFLHHPPLPVGIRRMDQIPLLHAAELARVVEPHRGRIRHIFHGHLHRPLSGSWRGIPFSSLRGTSHQVALNLAERPTVPGSHEPPAYGLVLATEEGVVVHTHDFLDATAAFDL